MSHQDFGNAASLRAITARNRGSWNQIAPRRHGEPASFFDVLAGVVAGRLRQHGSVLICDHHPVWEVLAVRGENRLAVTRDYFGRGRPANPDDDKQPAGARGQAGAPAFDAFVWPVSDVVMALVRAGLRLDAFFEAPSSEADGWPGLGDAVWPRIPAIYVIKATKTDPGPDAIA